MIAKLKGIIDTIDSHDVIIDVQGVGYLVNCSQKTLAALPPVGSPTNLIIETVVREDSLTLYGFQNNTEKEFFTLLTSVQGVGKKVGLAILSALTSDEIYQAITRGDKASFMRAEGVGPKLATRIVNELKEKVNKVYSAPTFQNTVANSANSDMEDAIAALTSLGYKRNEIMLAFNNLETKNLSMQELIRNALMQLARKAQ